MGGGVNKPGVHTKVSNMVNPNEAPRHLHISAHSKLCRRCGDGVRMHSYQRPGLLFRDAQKWSKSRAANKNSNINAPNNACVYGHVVSLDETGARLFPISAIISLTVS